MIRITHRRQISRLAPQARTSLIDPQTRLGTELVIRKVLTVGRNADLLSKDLEVAGISSTSRVSEAQAVICHGGDGTLIGAERDFPGIPKVPVRPDALYDKCPRHQNGTMFAHLAAGSFTRTRLPILEAVARRQSILAVNDVVIHNAKVTSAVRYRVWIAGLPYSGVIVGDGLVVSTPFGSTGYYRSITNSVIRVGIGLAFNNSTESVNHLVLEASTRIEVEITRGPGLLVADNMLDPVPLEIGDKINIHQARLEAEVYELEALTCMECRQHETGRPAGFLHLR